MSDVIERNSEILFLYDAVRCNPNGDMDNENKPRMDWDTQTNLVSDVRFKRYIRDYIEATNDEIELFVTEEAQNAEERVKAILDREPDSNNPVTDDELKTITETCQDIVYFGAVLGTSGANSHVHGPIQFNWGYSLNDVELQESRTINSSFGSGEGIGKDYRVNFSLLAFHGGINAKVAKETGLDSDDLKLFDEAMMESIPFCRTRSKIGQTPRLYLRVELEDDEKTLNDLREYVELENGDDVSLRSIDDVTIKAGRLQKYLENEPAVEEIYCWENGPEEGSLDIEGFNVDDYKDFDVDRS